MMTRPLFAVVALLAFLFAGRPPDNGNGDWRTFGRDPGAQRYSPLTQITPDNVTKLDWRIEKQIRFAQKGKVGLFFDMFNTFNSNVAINENWRSGASFLKATTVMPPRIVKFGAKFDW